jgi:hypothetical protein
MVIPPAFILTPSQSVIPPSRKEDQAMLTVYRKGRSHEKAVA